MVNLTGHLIRNKDEVKKIETDYLNGTYTPDFLVKTG